MRIEVPTVIPFTLTDDDRNAFSFTNKLLKELYRSMKNDSSIITCMDGNKKNVCSKQELQIIIYILEYFTDYHNHDWSIETN